MQRALLENGTAITGVYYCTHRHDEKCICRKPRPGLLYRAAVDYNIDLRLSTFIGDSQTDVRAARAAGCRPVLLDSGVSIGSITEGWVKEI